MSNKDVKGLPTKCPKCGGKIYFKHYTLHCEECDYKENY
jgi:ribosomal protein S27AE